MTAVSEDDVASAAADFFRCWTGLDGSDWSDGAKVTACLRTVLGELAAQGRLLPAGAKADVIYADGRHDYWSTHCREGRHDACAATELGPGVPRRPAQCKGCAAPCRCTDCDHRAPTVVEVSR